MITIRDLTAKDIESTVALIKSIWPGSAALAEKEMRDYFTTPGRTYRLNFIIATTLENEVVGVSAWHEEPFAGNTYGMSWAIVHPAYRNKGINTEMVDYRLSAIAAHNTADAYDVITRTFDNPMYRSRGFVSGFKDVIKHKEGKCILVAHFENKNA